MSMPETYRHKFIAGLHNALSGHTSEDVDEAVRYETDDIVCLHSGSLNRAKPSVWESPSRPVPTIA